MKQVIFYNSFYGGMTVYGDKSGPKGSFLNSKAIDFRKKPNQFSVLPATSNIGGGVVTDLIQGFCQVPDGTRYGLGNTGNFYKISTSNVVSLEADVMTGGAGIVYRADDDRIVLTGTTAASSYFPISGSPTIAVGKYGVSASTSATATGGTLTYTLATAIVENSTSKRSYTGDIEPLYSIKVMVIAKGTGTWTLTLHDGANNSLGTVSITTGNLTNNALNEFVFSTPIRQLVKPNARTYHFHLTSTVADGTVATTTAGDLSACDYTVSAYRFVTPNNGLHPAIRFLQYYAFGNERYLSVWEPLSDTPTNTEWERHKLTFESGYEVCGLALYNEFLAIAVERRSSTSTREFQDGRIYFWNGTDATYAYWVPVPEGSPYGLFQYKNVLYWFAGGAWWAYAGGRPSKLKTFPSTDGEYSNASEYTVVYPNSSTVRRGVLLMGYPGETSSTSVTHGIYSWGSADKNYPDSFGFSYGMSTGSLLNTGSNNLRIGAIKNYGDTLYMSWRDDANSPQTYGLDMVNNSSTPATSAFWESLIMDNGTPYKQKQALKIFFTCKTLPSDVSIILKYKINRATSWTAFSAVTTGTFGRFEINKPYYDIQIGADITLTGTTSPEVTTIGLEYDPKDNATQVLE
jgi:hypothetical protein